MAPRPNGYGFWLNGTYWGSMSTGPLRPDGTHDIYVGAVGADTHDHVWLRVVEDQVAAMGTQMKDQGVHIGGGQSGIFSTQAVARVHLTWDPSQRKVTSEFADVFSTSAYSAAPVVSQRERSNRSPVRVDVPAPPEARSVDCQFAVIRSSEAGSNTTGVVLIPFGGGSPFAVAMHVAGWSTG